MAQATTTRRRSAAGTRRRATSSRGGTRRTTQRTRRTANSRRPTTSSRKPASSKRPASSRRNGSPITGVVNGVGDTIGSAADKLKQPAVIGGTAAAAALAGGIALGSRITSGRKSHGLARRQTHLLRSVADDVGHVGKQIGKSGLRVGIGDVDMEVRRGRNNSNGRKSPIEVLLSSLTSRG